MDSFFPLKLPRYFCVQRVLYYGVKNSILFVNDCKTRYLYADEVIHRSRNNVTQ